jgi:LytR cell envelope-related transcriptional attenuator
VAKQTGRHSVGEDPSFLRSLVFFVVKWLGLALLPLLLLRGVWGLVTHNAEPEPTRAAQRSQTPAEQPTGPAPVPTPSPQAPAGPPPRIQILNGTDKAGVAATLATNLRHGGREVVSVAKARTAYAKTTILFQPGFEQPAQDLAATLGGAQVQPVSADVKVSKDIPLTLILGADYKPGAATAAASPSPAAKPSATPSASPTRSPAPISPSPSSSTVQVQVLNGTDVQGLGRRAADKLQAKGYLTPTVRNANNMYDRTVVYYQPGFQRNASEVVSILGTGTAKPAPDNFPKDVPLTVAVGKDFS